MSWVSTDPYAVNPPQRLADHLDQLMARDHERDHEAVRPRSRRR